MSRGSGHSRFSLGDLDSEQLADTFLNSIGGGSGVERVMELQWRQANVVSVERRPPVVEASGKVLHLHVERSPAPVPA